MTESDIASFMAPKTGVLHNSIRHSLDAGKQTLEFKKAEEERTIQEMKKVRQVSQIPRPEGKIIDTRYWEGLPLGYNAKGQIIDTRYGESGRYLDIK